VIKLLVYNLFCRFGRQTIVRVSITSIAVFTVSISFSTSYLLLVALSAAVGFACDVFYNTSFVLGEFVKTAHAFIMHHTYPLESCAGQNFFPFLPGKI